MTELERAMLHIKTRADAWAVKVVKDALSQEPTFDDECQKDMDEAWEQIQKKRKRIPVTLELKMTLDEAIIHAEEVADSRCDMCGQEHAQLAEWLKELKAYKEQEPCDDKRLFIKIYADYEPSVVAEKVYQICDEDEFPEVVSQLNAYLEPCTDAVSREAVKAYKYHRTMYPNFEDYVDILPSVQGICELRESEEQTDAT